MIRELTLLGAVVATVLPAFAGSKAVLRIPDGGTRGATASGAHTNLGAASSSANSDITPLTGFTTPLSSLLGGAGLNTGATMTSFTASISGGTLTCSGSCPNGLAPGQLIQGVGVQPGTTIYGSATRNTWPVSPSQTVGPVAMTSTNLTTSPGCPYGTLVMAPFSTSDTHMNCSNVFVPVVQVNAANGSVVRGPGQGQFGFYIRNRINDRIYGGMYALNAYTELNATSFNVNALGWYDGALLAAVARVSDNGSRTTSSAVANAGDTSITLTSVANIKSKDPLVMALDNGDIFATRITRIVENVADLERPFPSSMALGQLVLVPKGHVDGYTAYGSLFANSNATNFYSVDGGQITVSIGSTDSVYAKTGLLIGNDSADRVRGTFLDAALAISTVSHALVPQFKTAIALTPLSGRNPIGADGTAIRGYNSNTINRFLDFSRWSCATDGGVPGYIFIFSTVYSVDCAGNEVAGTLNTQAYTVSTLPAGVTGARAYVTDATVCNTRLGAIMGGGTTFCPVIYNGSAWVQQ
jgi:hypothetical protein